MKNFKLVDYLVRYPPVDTPQLQTLITAKREFSALASASNEPLPPKGQFLKHQQLTLRYMRAYDQLMVISETGTGKTGEIDIVTEYLKHEHFKSLQQDVAYDVLNSHFKRAIILVKGESLVKEFKNQLVNKFSTDYDNIDIILQQFNIAATIQPKKIIKQAIAQWYTIDTYERFAKLIQKEYKDNIIALQQNYNDSIVIIDEAHNLFIDDDTSKTIKVDKTWNKDNTYNYLSYFLHNIQRSKIMLATATPMLNRVSEVGKLINLILPEALQLPTLQNFKDQEQLEEYYQTIPLPTIEFYLRGRITYVAAFDTAAKREDQVNKQCKKCPLNPPFYTLYFSKMSKFQSTIYKQIYDKYGGAAYNLYLSYASNFVFPDGTFSAHEKEKKAITKDQIKKIKQDAEKKLIDYQSAEENEDENEEDEDNDENEESESEEEKPKEKKKQGFDKYIITSKTKDKKKQLVYKINSAALPPWC